MTLTPGSRPAARTARRATRTLLATVLVALGALLVSLGSAVGTTAQAHTGSAHQSTRAAQREGYRTAHHRTHHRTHHPAHRGPTRHVGRAFFGIHDASGHAYGKLPFGSIRLWDAGVQWNNIEVSPGVYHWGRLDSLVSRAQAHHVKVTLVLAMTPSFYAASPTQAPTDLSAYSRYVRAVMARYRSFHGHRGIESYQVWNEGNVKTFWTGTPAQLASLTAVVARARHAVDPHAKVLAPSFASRLPYQLRYFSAYQRQHVAGKPVWHYYDVNTLSLYPRATYGGRIGGPEDAIAQLQDVRRHLRRAHVPASKPIWASEINYGLPVGVPGQQKAQAISQRRQVANLLRTYLLGAARGLGRIYWFRYDMPLHPGGGTTGNTLLSDPANYRRLTAAGRALRIAERWLQGRLVSTGHHREPCSRNRHGTYTCTVVDKGSTRMIMWNPHREVRVNLPAKHGRVVAGKDGASRRTVEHRTVRVGFRPVMVHSRG